MTTKRVESLRAPCLDASSTLATSTFDGIKSPSKITEDGLNPSFFFVSAARSACGVAGTNLRMAVV